MSYLIINVIVLFALLISTFDAFRATDNTYPGERLLYKVSLGIMTFSAFLSLLTTHFFKVSDPLREVNATAIIFGYTCGVSLLIYVLLRNWLTTRKLKSLSNQELIDVFIAGSRVFVQCMEDASKQQNWKSWKAFTDIKQAYFEMERRDRTLALMLPLLRHDSDAVRMFAARRLLGKFERESLVALAELANGHGYVAAKSKEMELMWKQGKFKDLKV